MALASTAGAGIPATASGHAPQGTPDTASAAAQPAASPAATPASPVATAAPPAEKPPVSVVATPPAKPPRDLRLDFFRGLALWFIFIDHIPSSSIAQLTFRNFGFSDATEIFVFISGYTAALVYGSSLQKRGFPFMEMQVLKRCWQLYAAHILLFIFFIAEISWVAVRYGNASFLEELNVQAFMDSPLESVLDALILRYRPVNLDVLPMYMALLFALPLMLVIARMSRPLLLAVSLFIWWGVQHYHWAWPVYESGDVWFFNPMGWQLMFVIGILCCSVRNQTSRWLQWRPWLAWICVIYLVLAAIIAIGWRVPAIDEVTKPLVGDWLYPIDKNNLGPARVLHFLAVAYLVAHYTRVDAAFLRWPLIQPIIRCGQHSLHIFCLGIALSFVAHFLLMEFGRGPVIQWLVILGGMAAMSGLAYLLHWYKTRTGSGAKPPATKTATTTQH